MKSKFKNSFVFGALLFVALLVLLFTRHLVSGQHIALAGLVVVMAAAGVALFPRKAGARPIVRRESCSAPVWRCWGAPCCCA